MTMRDRPVYLLGDELVFPPATAARSDGLLAAYGDLSVERLLLAYRSGIFPWYSEGEPILWWSPARRAVFRTDGVHLARKLRQRTLRRHRRARPPSVRSRPRRDRAGPAAP